MYYHKKIDVIYRVKKNDWRYLYSTNRFKTCKEAVEDCHKTYDNKDTALTGMPYITPETKIRAFFDHTR